MSQCSNQKQTKHGNKVWDENYQYIVNIKQFGMEKNVVLHCMNNHEASRLCTSKACKTSRIECEDANCEYSVMHKKCTSIKAQEIYIHLHKKAQARADTIKSHVISCLDAMTKNIFIIRQQYNRIGEDYANFLTGCEKKMYQMFIEQNQEGLGSDLINQVVEKMSMESSFHQKWAGYVQQLAKDLLKRQVLQLEKLQGILNLQEQQPLEKNQFEIPLSFTSTLTLEDNFEIHIDQKRIKKTTDDVIYQFSLLKPSIEDLGHGTCNIKALKLKMNGYIGVAQKTDMIASRYKFPLRFQGIHLIRNDGFVYNHLNQAQHNTKGYFRFNKGDIIEMRYLKQRQEVEFMNRTTHQIFRLEGIGNTWKDLYYCVVSCEKEDQWQIIEGSQ